jgi:hypothetical protein
LTDGSQLILIKGMNSKPINLFEGKTSKYIVEFLNEFYPEGWKAYGLKWEGRSVKQWQEGKRTGWNTYVKGKWVTFCPLKEVQLLDLGDEGMQIIILNISHSIK